MAAVTLDSSALIALLGPDDLHHDSILKKIHSTEGTTYYISTLTMMEALVEPHRNGRGEDFELLIRDSVDQIVDLTPELASQAADIRAKSKLTLPDAVISATAVLTNSELWTFDKKLAQVTPGALLLK